MLTYQQRSGATRTKNTDTKWLQCARSEGFSTEAEMLCYMLQDMSMRGISEYWGCTYVTIQNRLRKHNLKSPRGQGGRRNNAGRPKSKKKSKQKARVKYVSKLCTCKCGGKLAESAFDYYLCLRCGIHVPIERKTPIHSDIIRHVGTRPDHHSRRRIAHAPQHDPDYTYGVDYYG